MSRLWKTLALSLLLALPALSQTVTGTMQGTVSDRSGGVLPGVTVTIRNSETGLTRIVVTNEAGFFNAPFLPLGLYDVGAELAGFGSSRRSNVRVDLNQTTAQDFLLDPAVTETVTVTADAPRINVADGEIKQTMRSEEIMAIPQANQTSFLNLASTFSGFAENPTPGSTNLSTLSVGSSINFNGAGTRGATFQIDGVNNDDASENQHRQGVALATIKSFQVLTNSFSSEFGRGYGAVVLVQTKSGTNDVKGELYGYAQDNKYNEKPFFTRNAPKPENYRRQAGFAAGFPIMRDRLFAFVHADRVDSQGDTVITRALLLPADMQLPRLTLNNNTAENRAWQDSILARFPAGVSPNATDLSARAYQYPQAFEFPDEDYSARVDWNASAANMVTGRYQRTHQIRDNGEVIIGEQTKSDNRASNFGLTWTNVLSSNTVQEVRYGLGLRSTNVNIKAGNDVPIVRFAGITFGPIIGNAGAYPINRNQRDQQFVYNLSTSRWAAHTLKVGTDIRRSNLDDRASSNTRGFWNFTTACGGVTYPSSIHAFFAGCVNSYQVSFGPDYLENRLEEANVYVQDDWRPWNNLTLNLGVRYEHVRAPEERQGRLDYPYTDTSYVDPRLGLAYVPNWGGNRFLRGLTGGNGRFSIRAGYGHYHGRIFQSIFSQGGANPRFNPPYGASYAITSGTNISNPARDFVQTGRITITKIDPELKMPETRQWNLTFERQVFSAARIRASYIGTFGRNLMQYRFDNLPVKPGTPGSPWTIAADVRCAGTGTPGVAVNAACPVPVPIGPNEVSLRLPRTNERRPDARYTTNLEVTNGAKSWYHGGQLEFETGLMHGFQGRMTYTLSKSIDTGSEATASGVGDLNIFPEDEHYKRGLSRFDTRHRFTMTGSYALPFFRENRGALGQILGGWQVSTIIRLASGTPFTITDSGAPDLDFDGVSNFRPIALDPNWGGGWHVDHPMDSAEKMNPTKFRRATVDDKLEDLMGRNTYYSDGLEQVDLGLYKSFGVLGQSVVLRLDVFNLFNHITWGIPTTDFANVNFGRILSTNYTPRTFQLGARFLF
ncbi:MAG TPA: TonB-dependent receptor [Thermoanaerobaculia bacterium]|nr:TonB-dependent receptor [Thermoanaerobaculia bacterium]